VTKAIIPESFHSIFYTVYYSIDVSRICDSFWWKVTKAT